MGTLLVDIGVSVVGASMVIMIAVTFVMFLLGVPQRYENRILGFALGWLVVPLAVSYVCYRVLLYNGLL